jgi:hypothetical protein
MAPRTVRPLVRRVPLRPRLRAFRAFAVFGGHLDGALVYVALRRRSHGL